MRVWFYCTTRACFWKNTKYQIGSRSVFCFRRDVPVCVGAYLVFYVGSLFGVLWWGAYSVFSDGSLFGCFVLRAWFCATPRVWELIRCFVSGVYSVFCIGSLFGVLCPEPIRCVLCYPCLILLHDPNVWELIRCFVFRSLFGVLCFRAYSVFCVWEPIRCVLCVGAYSVRFVFRSLFGVLCVWEPIRCVLCVGAYSMFRFWMPLLS